MKKLYVVMVGTEILGMFSTKEKSKEKSKELLIKHFTNYVNEKEQNENGSISLYYSNDLIIKEIDGEID